MKVKEGYNLDDVFNNVKEELERLHPDVNGKYIKADPQAMVKAFQSIISGITGFIALVSDISLFVSGVRVMNIIYRKLGAGVKIIPNILKSLLL